MSEEKETLTADDLDRVFLRVQDASGKWGTMSAKDVTDAQFDAWAKSRMPIQGDDAPWSPAERADFCNTFYQAGALAILKKEVAE